jgi:hypothetical protein
VKEPVRSASLTALIPCVGPGLLPEKLRDLERLSAWLEEVVVCFNGDPASRLAVEQVVGEPRPYSCRVSLSRPFNKGAALRAGLEGVRTQRVLYTDVDCLLYGEPVALDETILADDVCSFLVLRGPSRRPSGVRLKLARRRILGRVYDALGLYYLSVRGGGYVAGNMSEAIEDSVFSDDLVFSAEHAARSGARIVPSGALIFYEALVQDGRRYDDKIPRLIYGSFQAARLTRSGRLRRSLVVQKLAKYVGVALVPPGTVVALRMAGLPIWPAAALVLRWRLFLRTWEGIARGAVDAPPRW